MSFITGWLEEKATGYLKTGIQAGGTLAGNAVGGVGSLVEGAGKSAASGVTGGIGGVGAYINGYGDSVKQSMSADGPVSGGGVKKTTAVKPSTPVSKPSTLTPKPLPSTGGATKMLPSASGTQKAPYKPASAPKFATPGAKPAMGGSAKPPSIKPNGGVTKLPANTSKSAPSMISQPTSRTAANGKVMISPASRPKPAASKAKPAASSATKFEPTKNPLGIGDNFGDMGKKKK